MSTNAQTVPQEFGGRAPGELGNVGRLRGRVAFELESWGGSGELLSGGWLQGGGDLVRRRREQRQRNEEGWRDLGKQKAVQYGWK